MRWEPGVGVLRTKGRAGISPTRKPRYVRAVDKSSTYVSPMDEAEDGWQGGGPGEGVGAADDGVAVVAVREMVFGGDGAGGAGDGGEFGGQGGQGEGGGEGGGA